MNHSMINSMVTMQSLQQKLDIIANNMANQNTMGYKRKEATFEDILTSVRQQPPGFQKEGRLSPLGFNQGWGAKLSKVAVDLSQGTLNPTGVETDLSVEGDGLFEIDRAGDTLYTRDGSFELIPMDADNRVLTTKEGHFVHDVNGNRIVVPNGYKMVVDQYGNVTAGKTGAAAIAVGQLKLMRVVRAQYLSQIGDNLYALPQGAVNANGEILQDGNTVLSTREKPIAVRQGFLEQSNVNLADEMIEMMSTQRAFQLGSRAITSSDTMMNLANNLRA